MSRRLQDKVERKLSRKVSVRTIKQSFLIVCEGRNTEPEYFNAFRLTSAQVCAVGKGLGTVNLVREAASVRHEELRKGKIYDQYWVVFDKDDFPDADFNEAVRLAEAEGFRSAYSNQSFEFWFILHYMLYRGPMHRNQYTDVLTKLTGIPYSKRAGFATGLYNLLYDKLDVAIRNAEVLDTEFCGISPAKAESSTTVYKLVRELRNFL